MLYLEVATISCADSSKVLPSPAFTSPDSRKGGSDSCIQGDFVVLASEPLCLCGVDISAPPEARGRSQTLADMQESFRQQLAPREVSLPATCGWECSAAGCPASMSKIQQTEDCLSPCLLHLLPGFLTPRLSFMTEGVDMLDAVLPCAVGGRQQGSGDIR